MIIKTTKSAVRVKVLLFVLICCGCGGDSSQPQTSLGQRSTTWQQASTTPADSLTETSNAVLKKLAEQEAAQGGSNQSETDRDAAVSPDNSGSTEFFDEKISDIQQKAKADTAEPAESTDDHPIKIVGTWKRLGRHEIWVDFKNKQVMLGGNICLTQGQLEMFACPAGTKEHESVIAINAAASEMHAALMAIGAQPGKPCQWNPEYKPASGPVIDIAVKWLDESTQKEISRPAREMIMDFRTKQTMTHQWVFGGSELWKDPDTGDEVYYANSGEMICVSNFSTAALDLNVESSQSNDGLLFAAHTENIPPLGTKVYLILKPGQRIGAPAKTESPKTK